MFVYKRVNLGKYFPLSWIIWDCDGKTFHIRSPLRIASVFGITDA